jgi:alpha-galactosidase
MRMVKLAKKKQVLRLWRLLILFGGFAGAAFSKELKNPCLQLNTDSRTFTFTIPEVMAFKGHFSATIVHAGQTQELHSAEGSLLAPLQSFSEETPHGWATGTEVALRFDRVQLDLLVRFSQVPGVSGFQVQSGVRNAGTSPIRLLSLSPVVMEGRMQFKPEKVLVTALNTSVKVAPPVVALNEISQPLTVFEYGGFYSASDGDGFLFGPVGTPSAYVQASIAHQGEGKVAFTYTAEMSGVQVKPGETRWGQQVGLFAEPPRLALAHWAGWVAKTHKARTDKGALAGWNSWFFHRKNATGKDLLAEVAAVKEAPDRLRPMLMVVDRGYQDEMGLKETNDRFPDGLAFYAQRIATTGARPGLYLNFQGPPGWTTIVNRVNNAIQCGYTYLKINRSSLRLPPDQLETQTSFEAMRDGFSKIREAAGENTYILFNNNRSDRATVGFVDANRTGQNMTREQVRSAMTDVLRSYMLNGRWFAVDNDSYYMCTDIPNVSEIAGGWPLVRTWMSMVGFSCGAAITADPWHWESFRSYWRNVEVMTPPAKEQTEVLDLCTSREWPRLVGQVKRPWGDSHVALLWNPGTSERTVTLDFKTAGMNPDHRYAVWSFWDNRYLGVTRGSWTTPALGTSASQHLCFTDLDSSPDKPVLIGSSLHIYCGAAEIKNVLRQRATIEIELTDAGAREGDLFIYSRHQPIWKGTQGCTVTEIASAGEFVWRVHMIDRTCGATQRVTLGIQLPVIRQAWFWLLCGILAGSLIFALWRYVAYARLRQQHVLEQERARIARDLHDDIGAGLTEIAMQSSLVRRDIDPNTSEAALHRVDRVRQSASELTRNIDEIVWALNPANDTLERFVSYLSHATTQFLNAAGLAVRFDIPAELPATVLSGKVRHYLFLVLREALNNAVKYAKADLVQIRLQVADDTLSFVVEDNGCGFKPESIGADGTHEGLASMRDRLKEIGGQFKLTSLPGSGTRVEFSVPLHGPDTWIQRLVRRLKQ